MLRPQDVLIVLHLASHPERRWTYAAIGRALGLSLSEAHAGVDRATKSALLHGKTRRPIRGAVLEFMVHGFRFAFPPERGPRTRGIPTGPGAFPLRHYLSSTDLEPLVWPHARSSQRGPSLKPLYKTVPKVAVLDIQLYAFLTIADSLRVGGPRVRDVAADVLEQLLDG